MTKNQTIIDGIVDRCASDLFSAYGLPLQSIPVEGGANDFDYGAVLGFAGEALRGSLVLAMPADAIHQAGLPTSGPLRDWIGELSNQLLGRIKNRLLAYGIEIRVTIPVVVRGRLLSSESGADLRPRRYSTPGGEMVVWFEIEHPADFVLVERSGEEAHPEGSSMLF